MQELQNLFPGYWVAAIGSVAMLGLGASLLTQIIKHYRGSNWAHPDAMARGVLSVISFVTAAVTYVVNNPNWQITNKALPWLAGVTAGVVGFAHFWYWLTIQPVYKNLVTALQDAAKWRESTKPINTMNSVNNPTPPAAPPAPAAPADTQFNG